MREDQTFPSPAAVISAGGVWERAAVEDWAEPDRPEHRVTSPA